MCPRHFPPWYQYANNAAVPSLPLQRPLPSFKHPADHPAPSYHLSPPFGTSSSQTSPIISPSAPSLAINPRPSRGRKTADSLAAPELLLLPPSLLGVLLRQPPPLAEEALLLGLAPGLALAVADPLGAALKPFFARRVLLGRGGVRFHAAVHGAAGVGAREGDGEC